MEAERWKQVDEVLHSALQVPAGGERDEFLRQVCAGDAGLEQEVRSLIASDQSAGDFMENPAIKDAAQMIALNEGRKAGDAVLGQTISHYRVLRKLGSGGMGAVYEAEDLRLGRHVALKLLLDSQATSSKALQRFEQEARAISSLNHPNICTLHEVEEYDGKPVIVMELLEGQTLKERMKAGHVSLKELLEWGIDVADALDAAHASGLVHRDIKPANLFIGSRGQAKILDFGLAKLATTLPGAARAVEEDSLTSLGVIPGTTPFMSPEQVRGDDLDGRTDIFSLGTVLYEMATGECPFAERNVALTMNAVLNKRPPPPTRVNPDLPTELERVIDKTLEKDRNLRYQSAAQVRNDLQELKHGLESGQPIATGSAAAQVRKIPISSRKKSWKSVVLAIVVIVVLALGIYRVTKRVDLPFQNFTITQITETGNALEAAISPDGRYVFNVQNTEGAESIWLRNIATGSDTQIIPSSRERYRHVVFSPDGDYVYFLKSVSPALRNLYRVPVLGEAPQLIAQDVDTAPTFSPDAKRIAYVRGNNPEIGKYRLLSANLDGSDESVVDIEKIETAGNNAFPRFVTWSQKGDRIAYDYGTFTPEPGVIKAFDINRKRETVLARLPKNVLFEGGWLSEDRLMVLYSEMGLNSTHEQIGVISFDTGKLQPVTRDTNGYSTLTLSADKKTAATVQVRTARTLELISGSMRNARDVTEQHVQVERVSAFDWTANGDLIVSDGARLIRVGPDGVKRMALIDNPGAAILSLATCPNGYILVNWAFRPGTEGSTIWRLNSDGSDATQITHGTQNASPACTPDSKWVYYLDGMLTLMRVPLEGGQPEVVAGSAVPGSIEFLGGVDFSREGKRLVAYALVYDSANRTESKLVIIDLDAHAGSMQQLVSPDPRINASLLAGGPKFTPDGKALVYPIGRDEGAWNLWMQPLDGSSGHQITNFSSKRIGDFRWSPDGKTLAVTREQDTSDVVLLRQSSQ